MEDLYINYFNTLEPGWRLCQGEFMSLIAKLTEQDKIDAINFILNNLKDLGLTFLNENNINEILENIIDYYSELVGLDNKVDFLISGLPINKKTLINGALEADNVDIITYLIENDEFNEIDIEELSELAVSFGSVEVLKKIIEILEDEEFCPVYYDLILTAAYNEQFDILKYFLETGIVTLDKLKEIARKKKLYNITNFLNSFSVLGKRKREEAQYPTSKRRRY